MVSRYKAVEIEFVTLSCKIVLIRHSGIVIIRIARVIGDRMYIFIVETVAIHFVNSPVFIIVGTIGIRVRKSAFNANGLSPSE